MTTLSPEQSVAELVLERPSRSRLFESLGIDYCCGGKKSLREACERKQLDVKKMLERLKAEEAAPAAENAVDLRELPLGALIEDILAHHHKYLRRELPRLEKLMEKVNRVHGAQDARLQRMARVLAHFQQELQSHMMKEEHILFPVIAQMAAERRKPKACFQTIAHPIRQMEREHDGAGDALDQLRALSDGYTPPDWACNTYRALLDGLSELEQNMHLHVHKENNILFPRAIELETLLGNSQ